MNRLNISQITASLAMLFLATGASLLDDEADASAVQLHARLERHYDLGERTQAIAEIETHLEGLTALGLVRCS